MTQEPQGPDGTPGMALLAVAIAAAVGGLYLVREPLQSSRPKDVASFQFSPTEVETVDARLWQDPLQAIQSDWNRLVTLAIEEQSLPPFMAPPPTIANIREAVANQPDRLLVIGALVSGGPYANDAEDRRRSRYALIAALTEAEFVPSDSDRIGYFLSPQFAQASNQSEPNVRWERLCNATGSVATRCPLKDSVTLVGFEWFKPRRELDSSSDVRWKSVLVLWLNDSNYSTEGNPLSPIRSLLQEITRERKRSNENNTAIAFIGPFNSEFLTNIPIESSQFNPAGTILHSLQNFPEESRRLLLKLVTPVEDIEESVVRSHDSIEYTLYVIDSYLDYGLPQQAEQVLRDCLGGSIPLEECLERDPIGNIVDSDPNWRNAVVYMLDGYYDPDPNEVDFLVQDSIENTLYMIDSYLDYGLPQQAEQVLRDCLGESIPLEECLERDPIGSIVDSDPIWKITVFFMINGYAATTYPEDTAAEIRSIANGTSWIQSLLLAAHYYLDYGLPLPKDREMLRACLVTAPSAEEAQHRSAITACLRTQLQTEDSDPEWHSTVVDNWLASNAQNVNYWASSDPQAVALDSSESHPPIPLHVISPRSTVPLSLLLEGQLDRTKFPEDSLVWDQRVRDKLGVRSFRSVLARDDVVLQAIVKELEAQGLGCEKDIAIVSELDSNYGRAMQRIVDKAILKELDCSEGQEPTVHYFGYLGGVDGEMPLAEENSSVSNEQFQGDLQNAPEATGLFVSPSESAVGSAQMDYIRRLADDIGRHSALHGEELQAIGVFGTDIYDKQLIIQALRERLPNVRYFTTDLDARLADSEDYRWNRNLIVGSAYGLSWPANGCQAPSVNHSFEVPPFRDSYQTAFFRAVQMALNVDNGLSTIPFSPPQARVFEIGRSGAIDITPYTRPTKLPCSDETGNIPYLEPGWLQYAGGKIEMLFRIIVLLMPLVILALSSLWIGLHLPEKMPARAAHETVLRYALGSTLFIGFILLGWNKQWQEPLLLLEGISAVPTLVLHLTAIFYAVAIVIIAQGRITQSNTDVADQFNLDASGQGPEGRKDLIQLYRNPSKISLMTWTREIAENRSMSKATSVREIWQRYRTLGSWNARLARALPWAVFWTAVVLFLISLDPTPLLARHIGALIESIRVATLFTTLITVCLCTDALRLGQVFIQALTATDIDGWSKFSKYDDILKRRWLTMQLIVAHTKCVSPLIVLPFVLVFLLLLARSTIFDGWPWTPRLIAVYAGFSSYLLARAFLFQRSANQGREDILNDLDMHRRTLTGDEPELKRTEILMDEIRSIHSGAFVPWTRHPILQSVAVPSGGVGLIALLEVIFL